MKTETKNASCLKPYETIVIGKQMENNYRQFVFDCSGFGDVSSIMLVHQRSEDVAPYVVGASNTSALTWSITNTDTAFAGNGEAELRISFADGLAKSVVFRTTVIPSITADTVIPEPLQSWYDALIDYIESHSIAPEDIAQAVEDYMAEHPVSAPVTSVNAQTGAVVLTALDVGALPDSTIIPTVPTNISAFTNDAGYITSAVTTFNGQTGAVTYTPPVTSVNNQTGAVTLTASDVNALPSSTVIPTKTSDLVNDSGYITVAPVTSVNGQTGAVTIDEAYYAEYGTATSAEIETAYQAGSFVYTMYQDRIYALAYRNSATNHRFTSVYGAKEYQVVCQSNVWIPNAPLTYSQTDTNTTYTISISGNVISLTPSSGAVQTITLPVYSGGVI